MVLKGYSRAQLFGNPIIVTFNLSRDGTIGNEFGEYSTKGYVPMGFRLARDKRVVVILGRQELLNQPGETFRARAIHYVMETPFYESSCGYRAYRFADILPVSSEHASVLAERGRDFGFDVAEYSAGKERLSVATAAGKIGPLDIANVREINRGTRAFSQEVERFLEEVVRREFGLSSTAHVWPIPVNERTLKEFMTAG
ncbi:MAG: hypothetical protein HYT72_01465 [Candidatus Aenigmarchaeota archaeon]|nr:hypothetical protein [Candidatus Aenigmarchaeota archaeon]